VTAELAALAIVLVLPAVIVLGALISVGLIVAVLAASDDAPAELDERRLLRGLIRA
jgi:hypothetical protein